MQAFLENIQLIEEIVIGSEGLHQNSLRSHFATLQTDWNQATGKVALLCKLRCGATEPEHHKVVISPSRKASGDAECLPISCWRVAHCISGVGSNYIFASGGLFDYHLTDSVCSMTIWKLKWF
jgi:hypothetical protein